MHATLSRCAALTTALLALQARGGSDDAPPPRPSPAPPPAAAKVLAASDCNALAHASGIANGPVISATTWVEADTQKAAAGAAAFLPAHCIVRGTIDPRNGRDGVAYGIGFELRLPARWNSRFFFQGGSGTDGTLAPAYGTINSADGASNVALMQGYAVVSTDGGHENALLKTSAAFGVDPQARIDYGYDAIDRTATTAKSLLAAAYGKGADHSYFVGCSNGGRQGMQFSQRFPGSFDGIVAGDPVMDLGAITAAEVWGLQQVAAIAPKDASGATLWHEAYSASDRQLYTNAYLKACDAADGVVDGMVQNAAACHFDPATLQCSGSKTDGCLSAAQVAALRELGYTIGQGFHLAEPMTADGVAQLLARRTSVAPRL